MNLIQTLVERHECYSPYSLYREMYEGNEMGPNVGFHLAWPGLPPEWVYGCNLADYDELLNFDEMEKRGVKMMALSISFEVEGSCAEVGPEEFSLDTPIEVFDIAFEEMSAQAKRFWERDNCPHMCLRNLSTEEQYSIIINPYDETITPMDDLASLDQAILDGLKKRAQGGYFKVPGWTLKKIPQDVVCSLYA